MSHPRTPTDDPYDPGTLVGPPTEVTANALRRDIHDDDVGDLLIAMLGWDGAVQSLCDSDDRRSGQVLVSVLSWLLIG